MRLLHPAAWIGFILNCAALYAFFRALGTVDLSQFSQEERALIEMLLQGIESLRFFYYGVLVIQALALGLLATRAPFGLGLAVLGAILMLPGSLLYLIGCILSHFQAKYADFNPAPVGYSDARFIYPSSTSKKMRTTAAVALGLSLMSLFLGWLNFGTICFGLALAALYFAIRSRKNHPLSLHDDYFTLTPGVFAPRILIPYASVRLATLRDDESIHFQVENSKGIMILSWTLRSIEPEFRRSALEELGAALSAHGVPLE